MTRYLLSAFLILSFVFNGLSQKIDYDDYQATSKWFLGADLGHLWHTSDVKNVKSKFPIGAGINLGRSFNQNYGTFLSYDIRLRLLGGSWYGQDKETTNIENNYAVSQYYDTLGYAVQNFRARQTDLSIELALHLNRVRERTGIDPYIFGALGVTFTQTKGDLVYNDGNGFESIYPYDVNTSSEIIKEDYTIPLDKNETGEFYKERGKTALFMPSLGIGIGYYFNSRFSIGFEHRSTFFPNDYFDGTTINQSGEASKLFKNDVYHYTSFYLKFYLKSRKQTKDPLTKDPIPDPKVPVQPEPDRPTQPDRPNGGNQTTPRPPIIDFTNPSRSSIRVNTSSYQLKANVQYVDTRDNLVFTRNGSSISNFSFNANQNAFISNVTLVQGENTFRLQGYNQDGNDEDIVTIIYEIDRPTELPPTVNITDPASSPYTVNQLSYTVHADIQNISARNQLQVTFNNNSFTDYSFSPNGNINFSANLNLQSGVNELKIVGTNNVGTASDNTVLIYRRGDTSPNGTPPVVKITRPAQNPYVTNNLSEVIEATVANVTSKSQIEVRVNNVVTNNFSYSNNKVAFTANLQAGGNQVNIYASNEYGSDSDNTQINYQRSASNPPLVHIIIPNDNPYHTNSNQENIVANVQNITQKSQVNVSLNGVHITNFTYNNTNKLVEFTAPLSVGTNNIQITATNNDGTANDAAQIIYERTVKTPPVVTIIQPSSNPYSTSNTSENVIASVQNVTQKSQVSVSINGANISNFTFNNNNKTVSFTAPLNNGTNNIKVTATNNDGTDSDATQIIFKRQATTPPTVKILQPSTNPYTTGNSTENIIASVQNITQKSQISVSLNGVNISNFDFNSTAKTATFTAPLNVGTNNIQINVSNNDGSDSDATQIVYKAAAKTPPTVNIIKPNSNPYTTSNNTENIIASVQNITQKSQIKMSVNGANISNFTFDSSAKTVTLEAPLNGGTNNIQINVSNHDGSDSDGIQIIYRKPVSAPPIVTITDPSSNPVTTEKASQKITAKVQNITQKSQIAVKINGVNTSNFSYNSSSNMVDLTVQLKTGLNIVQITATNNDGTSSDTRQIVYQRTAIQIKPIVSFVNPPKPNLSVSDASFKMIATVEHAEKNGITVTINGKSISRNSFSFNSTTHEVIFETPLKVGKNTIAVKASNSAGSVTENTYVNRLVIMNKPKNPFDGIDIPTCGVYMDMSVVDYDICINTPSGTFTKATLNDPNFTYSGEAKGVYFKAASNGKVTAANQDYAIVQGNYYEFFGILDIEIKKVGDKWNICIESGRFPFVSTPEDKSPSNCAPQQSTTTNQKKPSNQKQPTKQKKPTETKQPQIEQKPRPTINNGSSPKPSRPNTRQEPSRGTSRR